ncbi:MAG: phosphoenolpyruvate synthase [Simkaniaceae bacterium]|nr:phosphoenolpyruvate synthase [Candidatus Sacchlamyda saccharinae]
MFDELGIDDVPVVGGKNASLGEMIRTLKKKGIRVPLGFATTAEGFHAFLDHNHLRPKIFRMKGAAARKAVMKGTFPKELRQEIVKSYRKLCGKYRKLQLDVAVRSSATAEDLPEASFAGQQESYLNIVGEKALLLACKKCYASLFTDRAIAYREEKGFAHDQVALSVGIQKMVRSDEGSSGVLFTLDTETGFPDMVVINAAFGLGENVVQGTIEPDEFMVYKPFLTKKGKSPIVEKILGRKALKMVYRKGGTRNIKLEPAKAQKFAINDTQILQLAKWAVQIEEHYKKPMDIEWALDGKRKELFIVQARPETVQSQRKESTFKTYALQKTGKKLLQGLAIGQAVVQGKVQVIRSVAKIKDFKPGSILVTEMTSPDWVPIMKQASGIITDHGGRTSHAAIVSRELGVPAIVGSNDGTKKLAEGKEITLSCAEGDIGNVYEGKIPFEEKEIDLKSLPKVKTDIMLNLASPHEALRWWQLPVKGVGLARMEFIITNQIKIHPMALVHFRKIKDAKVRQEIEEITRAYKSKQEHFIENLALGIGKIAASVYPHPVIVRMSDFKTNEYAGLIGGTAFEPKEDNPMLGFRGASRYYSPRYQEGFALECKAIKRVREKMGFDNVLVMIPFCRTPDEADKVLKVMADEGLKRKDLKIYVMCEIPSNVIQAEEFADRFDGFSIGSNDLTQLVLGVDRDAEDLATLFDERNESVKQMIRQVIKVARKKGKKIGICGQAPSDYPDFAAFLVEAGINSISLNPDSVIGVIKRLAATTTAS